MFRKEGLDEAQSLFDTALTFLDSCEPITSTDKPSHNTKVPALSRQPCDSGSKSIIQHIKEK
jgi:hypothetical protein